MVLHDIDKQEFLDGFKLNSNFHIYICNEDGGVLKITSIRGDDDGLIIYVK